MKPTVEYSQHMMLLRTVAIYLEQDADKRARNTDLALAAQVHAAADKLLRRANWLPGLEEVGNE